MARIRTLQDVHPNRRGLVLAWFAFTVTFGFLRLLTWAIHVHVKGLGNITAGSVHVHHYLWGILLLVVVAALGLIERTPAWHGWMGLLFGVGLALVVDEAALLIELKDVYWDGAGGVSVALAVILIGAAGSALALSRAWQVLEAEQGESAEAESADSEHADSEHADSAGAEIPAPGREPEGDRAL